MATRKSAALIFTGVGAFVLLNNAQAQEHYIGVDGCAVLAQLVYTELTAAARYGPVRVWALVDAANDMGIVVCHQTTGTVSKAFTSAMTSKGSPVRLGYPSICPDDVRLDICPHHCHPDRSRLGATDTTWKAVGKTVRQAMPNGVATDRSVFNPSTMRLALRFALGKRTNGTITPLAESLHGVGAKARPPRRL